MLAWSIPLLCMLPVFRNWDWFSLTCNAKELLRTLRTKTGEWLLVSGNDLEHLGTALGIDFWGIGLGNDFWDWAISKVIPQSQKSFPADSTTFFRVTKRWSLWLFDMLIGILWSLCSSRNRSIWSLRAPAGFSWMPDAVAWSEHKLFCINVLLRFQG